MKTQIDNLLSRTGDIALRRRAKWILNNILERNPMSILDGGCGDGFYLHLMSNLLPKTNLAGVDNDAKALESAKRNLYGKKVKLINGNLLDLKFQDKTFDIILLSEVLEHIADDVKALKEAYRLLKPRGVVIISVPNANYPFLWDPINWVLARVFNYHISDGFFAGIWNQHERLYSRKQLVNLLKKTGFHNINTHVLTKYCLPFNHYLLNICARILAKSGSTKTKQLSKFNGISEESKFGFSPFSIVFQLDQLNDLEMGGDIGVSLVAAAGR